MPRQSNTVVPRKRAGAWLFWIAPLTIASAAWMGIAYYGYKVDGALASGSIDADMASRIRAAGASESLSLLVFGAGYIVLLLAAATVLVGVRALGHQKGRFGAGAILALLGAIGLGGISLFARPLVISKLGGWLGFNPGLAPLLSVPCWFATAIGATCVGAALSSAERDPEHDGLAMGDALAAFTAAALAMSAVVACEYVSRGGSSRRGDRQLAAPPARARCVRGSDRGASRGARPRLPARVADPRRGGHPVPRALRAPGRQGRPRRGVGRHRRALAAPRGSRLPAEPSVVLLQPARSARRLDCMSLGKRSRISAIIGSCSTLVVSSALGYQPIGVSGHTQDLAHVTGGEILIVWTSGGAKSAAVNIGKFDEASGKVVAGDEIATGIDAWFGRPLLAVSPNGAHVQTVWNRDIPGSDHGRVELAVREAGGTWTVSTVIEQGDPWHYTQPSVAVRNDGSSHVAYQQWPSQGSGEYTVYTWRAAGGAFSTPVQVSGNGGRDVAMLVDHDSGLHLRYSRGYRHAPLGKTLDQVPNLAMPKAPGSSDGPFFGDMSLDATDTVHLVFDDCVDCSASGTHAIGHTTIPIGGSSFATPTRASAAPFPGEDPWPAVGVDAKGTVYVMWCPSTPTTSECKLSIRVPSGGAWSESTLDAQAGMGRVNKPTVLVTSAAVYGFWRTGSGEIVMEELSSLVPATDAGPSDATGDGSIDAPVIAPDGGSADAGHGLDAAGGTEKADAEGCGCSALGERRRSGVAWLAVLAGVLTIIRRRRTAEQPHSFFGPSS